MQKRVYCIFVVSPLLLFFLFQGIGLVRILRCFKSICLSFRLLHVLRIFFLKHTKLYDNVFFYPNLNNNSDIELLLQFHHSKINDLFPTNLGLIIIYYYLMIIHCIFLLCLTVGGLAQKSSYVITELNNNWQMNLVSGPSQVQSLKSKTYKTTIPTTVHLDLLTAKDIPDPFLNQNYPQVKWVSDCSAKYSVTFSADQNIFQFAHQQLVFEGIDTYSDVYLNKVKILSTENAFRKYVVGVKQVLKKGENLLQVIINSTNPIDNEQQRLNQMPFPYAHTRKACYQYSWDWAPYLNTLGIWKQVYLESFEQTKIDYVWVRTRSISKQTAVLNFAVALENAKDLEATYQYKIYLNDKQIAGFPASERYSYYDIKIDNPKLWWPNGIGKPHIYDFVVTLVRSSTNTKVDERKIPYGIRIVEMDKSNKKFEIKINGYSVYCKGANYVPPDMFYPRLSNAAYTPANSIEALIDAAVESNFNMLRIWGGGQYQSDKFLQLASRKGIMLFYDFMFSDSVYPSTEKFLLNVQEQIKQQIRRARNYPALTIWSGNNEILQGINDWGWARQNYKEDYRRLFEILIPKIIEYQSPYIPYIPSSPVYGVGNYGLDRGGDAHYWGVWAGGAEFESYIQNIGKFNSEFGTQGLPVWETIVEKMSSSPSYETNALLLHERHNSRFNTLKNYMNSYMKVSLNFELQTYQSGLLQAYAIEVAIKAQRIAKPNSYGTLYWQFNDAWPAISWSSIDYLGRWKPLQFMAKRLFPDVSVFTQNDKISAINDKLYEVNTLVTIEFFKLDGTLVNKIELNVVLKANEVQLIHNVTDADYKGQPKADVVIYTEIVAGKDQTMGSTHFNVRFKDLNLVQAEITVEYHPDFNEFTVSSNGAVVKNLFISHSKTYLKLSNNYFDLLPGHPVKVVVQSPQGLAKLQDGLVFRSYREVYTPDSKVVVKSK